MAVWVEVESKESKSAKQIKERSSLGGCSVRVKAALDKLSTYLANYGKERETVHNYGQGSHLFSR